MMARKNSLAVFLLAAALPVLAQQLADGEIRKVDRKAGTVTIKHGPIPAIDMPPMTMVFHAKNAAMLRKLKPGDKVKFQAEMGTGGKTVVTRIEPAKKAPL